MWSRWGICLPSDVEELGVKRDSVQCVANEVGGLVWVFDGAAVPVIWDTLCSLNSLVITIRSLDTEPRLDGLIGKLSDGVLGAVVGHESIDKGVRGGLHEYTTEGSVEEVRVSLLLRVEPVTAELCEGIERDHTTGRVVDQILELLGDTLVVVASLVQIWSGWGCVGLILVV